MGEGFAISLAIYISLPRKLKYNVVNSKSFQRKKKIFLLPKKVNGNAFETKPRKISIIRYLTNIKKLKTKMKKNLIRLKIVFRLPF
jgi:hypothetical protein